MDVVGFILCLGGVGDVPMIYIPDETKPKAVIVDVDGTVAHMHSRGPFDWKKVGDDNFDYLIGSIVEHFHKEGYEIIFLSGRDSVCHAQTEDWLEDHFSFFIHNLYMRQHNDYRKDSIIKKEIFFRDIAPHYNIVAVIDDRPQVVRMWHEIKIPKVICVGNPWEEF